MIHAPKPLAPVALRAQTALTMVPGQAPIDDAVVVLRGRRILAVGPRVSTLAGFAGSIRDLGPVTLVPGPINAHCHLELSHLEGRSPRGQGFAAWAGWLGSTRGLLPTSGDIARAVAALVACGTGAVIDMTGRHGPLVANLLEQAGLAGLVCHEYAGFRRLPPGELPPALAAVEADLDLVRLAAAGHALYSTSPDNLRRARAVCRRRGVPFCLHLAETRGEVELLTTGGGELAALLGGRLLPRGYQPPGRPPVAEALDLDLLGPDTLAAHAVWLDAAERARLAASGAAVCLCPRSNAHIGVGTADAAALHAAGIPLCLGTDSLASNDDLDLWNEARALLAANPGLPPRAVLEALTVNPARLLGRSGELGRLAPGALGGYAVLPDDLAVLHTP